MQVLPPTAALLLLGLLTPAVAAPASTEVSGGPTADEIRRAFGRVQLRSCDELSCYYRLAQRYDVRSVRCRFADGGSEMAICTYERTPLNLLEVPIVSAGHPAPTDKRTWFAAETALERLDHGWWVVTDSDD